MKVELKSAFNMLYLVNIIHWYFDCVFEPRLRVNILWNDLQIKLIFINLVPNEPYSKLLPVLERLKIRASHFLSPVWLLKTILYNEFVLEEVDHLSQLLVLFARSYDGVAQLFDGLVLAPDSVFKCDYFFFKFMFFLFDVLKLGLLISLLILHLEHLLI